MPGTRITLAKNSQQTVQSTVVLQLQGIDPQEAITSILRSAEKKLRIRKPSRVFLSPDGTELSTDTVSRITNGTLLLVSSGEDFIGAAKQDTQQQEEAPIKLVHSSEEFVANYIEPQAILQLRHVARLPGILRAVGMPDLHPSDTFPIGAAIESFSCIYPALIGGDVGCGMALYQTTLSSSARPKRICEKLQGIEGPWKEGDVFEWLERNGISSRSKFDEQLGTIGGGNHFAEIQRVEEVREPEQFCKLGLDEDKLFLLVHSGSRALGKDIAHLQPIRLMEGTPEFDSYMEQHDYACKWARCNRELIAHRILTCLSGLYADDHESSTKNKVLDIWHNNVSVKNVKGEGSVWLHRKGAAPSDQGMIVIPGSRGSFSYLVEPIGDQRENSYSVAHGAGRSMTRGVALGKMRSKASTENAVAAALQVTELGSRVICEDMNLLFEEAPGAYKCVEAVVEELVNAGIIRIIAVYRPVVTYKKRLE